MRVVTAEEIDRSLSFPALMDALHEAFASAIASPERHHHVVGDPAHHDGQPIHLIMPAWSADAPSPGSFLGTKLVNVFPKNGAKGLPSVMGTYVLFSGETGAPLAALDGTRLTVWRTAAASGLASRFLSHPDASRLLMVGAGAMAPFLIGAHAAARPIRQVTLWNRTRARSEALAASLAGGALAIEIANDLETAVASADVISCATLSSAPLIRGDWLRPGQHLDLVGAFTLQMREADDTALTRARVFVDTPAALTEGGDVAAAIKAGAFAAEAVQATLRDLCDGSRRGRGGDDEITLFKSVGASLEDLAAAMLVWRGVEQAA